ncbi:9520_t:CDS:2 [Gigaspora rosea]|nr:9520_t:CDS:2 [Gigaspora rosea]
MLFSIPHRSIGLYHTGFTAYTTQVLWPIPHRFDGLTSTLTTPDLCRSSG